MSGTDTQTESMNPQLLDLDLRSTEDILETLLQSQRQAVACVSDCDQALAAAVNGAADRLENGTGRLVMAGAGASGRLAVQDGAEMWPTYGWPHERLVLAMAGGEQALVSSIEGVEDDAGDARKQVESHNINRDDVVVALAASGRSAWTCGWLLAARAAGAYTIGISNNSATPLLEAAEAPVFLNSGAEVLAGSTRMAAGTAQKVALNVFSTALMVRLNRTWGNLMVDMAAVNSKLDDRRMRMLQTVLPELSREQAEQALAKADGWVKLAALIAKGVAAGDARKQLEQHKGSLRQAMAALE